MSVKMLSYLLGSIIGTGVLTLPSLTLGISLIDVLISLGITSLLFSGLGFLFSKTSNPFLDIKQNTTSGIYSFVSVSYWVSIWTGTMLGIYEMSNEILAFFSINITSLRLGICQVTVVVLFTFLQKIGMKYVNKVEVFMTSLKMIFVIMIPVILIFNGNYYEYKMVWKLDYMDILSMIPQMMWMYLGIESCSIVSKDERNVTSTVISSVIVVFCVYAVNIIGVMTSMHSGINLSSAYPSLISSSIGIYGNQVSKFMSIFVIVMCMGSTNSWYVMSARTFQSLTSVFARKYTSNYFYAVLFSSIGLIPLSIIVSSPDVKLVFSNLIDVFGVISSLFYLVSSYAIMKKYRSFLVGVPVFILLVIFFIYCVYSRFLFILSFFN